MKYGTWRDTLTPDQLAAYAAAEKNPATPAWERGVGYDVDSGLPIPVYGDMSRAAASDPHDREAGA